jgi:hypothetical protein
MRSLWKRGLNRWPYLVAAFAFVVSTGFATRYGMEHVSVPRSPTAAVSAIAAADPGAFSSRSSLRGALAEVFASIESVGAVFWPLMTLLVLLVTLRLGAAIAGIGYDCGRLLMWATAVVLTAVQLRGAA